MERACWQRRFISLAALVATLALASCGQAPHPGRTRPGRPVSGGTVNFAGYVGEGPSYLFPMYTSSYWDVGYVPWFSYLMWRPLYVWGTDGKPLFNAQRSLAYRPAFSTNAAGDTVAAITLKPWRWSDGRPLTTRDVQFWMNLLEANKANWAPYVPGKFPDNVKSIQYPSARKFVITFNGAYSANWLLGNQLSQITPIPQRAWDKVSASSPVGNYDMTPGGARRVYAYLQKQAATVATYATNPLWQVVDGAWEISSYTPVTNYVAFKPNPDYSGTVKPRLHRFVEVPFTSAASEFNALESGRLQYGYVPLNDLSAIPSLKAKGYRIVYWPQYTWGGVILNYAPKDPATPILKQLYVRAAMTHLISMGAILRDLEHGLGYYAAGPIPNPGGTNPLVSSYAKHDPYPYSVSAAKRLLTSHGWRVVPNGVSTCQNPGTGPNQCGAGIRRGAPLQFTLLSQVSSPLNAAITQLLKSTFSLAGIDLTLHIVNSSTELTLEGNCIGTSTCAWQLNYSMEFWPWGWPDWYPTGSEPFGCGSSSNYMNWCDPQTQRLIQATHLSSSVAALHAYDSYIAKEEPFIALPMPVFRVSAVKDNLHGVAPQDPYLGLYPNDWYYTKQPGGG